MARRTPLEVVGGTGYVRRGRGRGQDDPLVGRRQAGGRSAADTVAFQHQKGAGVQRDDFADRCVGVGRRVAVERELVDVLGDDFPVGGGRGVGVELEDTGVAAKAAGTSILNGRRLEERHQALAVGGQGESLETAVVATSGGRGGVAGEVEPARERALRREQRGRGKDRLHQSGLGIEAEDGRAVFVAHPIAAVSGQHQTLCVQRPSAATDGTSRGLGHNRGVGVGGIESRVGKPLAAVAEQNRGGVGEGDLLLRDRTFAVVWRDDEVVHLEARTEVGGAIAKSAIRQAYDAARDPARGVDQRIGVDGHCREAAEGVLPAVAGLVEGGGRHTADAHQALIDESGKLSECQGRGGRENRYR